MEHALADSTVTITSLSIDAVSSRANLPACPPVHCFPREALPGCIHALGRQSASGSDACSDQERNVAEQAWLTSAPTLLGHSHSDTDTLELLKHNVHYVFCRHVSLSLAPLWKCLAASALLAFVCVCVKL